MDIFISYSSSDRDRVRLLAKALGELGWSVWWDRSIPPGKTFDEVIEEALDAAKCVIVIWSAKGAASRWVRTEAAEGSMRGVLVPVLIEDVQIPLAFRRIQTADLSDWEPGVQHRGFDQIVGAIADLVGTGPGEAVEPPTIPQPVPSAVVSEPPATVPAASAPAAPSSDEDERRRLEDLYDEGASALASGRAEDAVEAFTELEKASPGYRDAAARLDVAKRAHQAASQYQKVGSLVGSYERGGSLVRPDRWQAVLDGLREVDELDPNHGDPKGYRLQAEARIKQQRVERPPAEETVPAAPPSPSPKPPPAPTQRPPPRAATPVKAPAKRRRRGAWLVVIALAAGGAGVAVTQLQDDSTPDDTLPPGPSPTTAAPTPSGDEPAAPVDMMVVPDLDGMSLDAASSALVADGFHYALETVRSDLDGDGLVLSQDPAGGSELPAGAVVTIWVGEFPSSPAPMIAVPDLGGLQLNEASTVLSAAGFLYAVEYEPTDSAWDGRVLGQDPESGTAVQSGTVITIWVGALDEEAEYNADISLIVDLWEGYNQAWADGGYLAAAEYQLNWTYPYDGLYDHTPESCNASTWPEGPPDYFYMTVDTNRVTRVDELNESSGVYDGVDIEGRIYEVWVSWIDSFSPDEVVTDTHAVVSPSGAWASFFFPCDY